MKKYIFILGLSLFSFSSFLISCSDDNDNDMCTCVESDYESGYSAIQEIDPSSFGANNCNDLAIKLRMVNGEEFEYDCD